MLRHLVVVAVVVIGAVPVARADVLTPTLGEPLSEISHTVDVSVDKGVATMKVRRVFANAGTRADEAGLEIDLPYGAAATGLRIRARTRWFDGELLEAEEAARLYHEMTGFGAHKPKDPALLQWVWADKLYLQVFPVLPGATSTVEYTLTVPTRYERGRVYFSYPHTRVGAGEDSSDIGAETVLRDQRPALLARPVLTVRPSWGDATTAVLVDNARKAPDTPFVLEPPTPPAWAEELGIDTSSASVVKSTIEVPDVAAARGPFSSVSISLDVEHTYKSDLRIDLRAPNGELVSVFDGSGGDANDVRGAIQVALPKPTSGVGTWLLIASDVVARDAGTLSQWTLSLGGNAAAAAPPAAKGATGATGATPGPMPGKSKGGPYVAQSTDTPVYIPDAPESAADAGSASISIDGPPVDVLAARLGRAVASKEHAFARLEIDTARELSALPRELHVVFLIDASHSVAEEGIDAQLALVRGQLAHVPDAKVELVAVRRRAARVFGRFVPAREIDGAVAAARAAGGLEPGNGSALDEGVRAAIAVLATAPANKPQRVVAFTDELLRSAFQIGWPLDALHALPRSAVVHVVAPSVDEGDETRVVRDDAAALAPLAREHHGIFARVDGLPAPDKQVAAASLALVRPVQLDAFVVEGMPGVELAEDGSSKLPTLLHEGDGVRLMVGVPDAPAQVVVRGKLWNDDVRRTVRVDDAFSRATAAFVFGEDEHHELSPEEMMRVAQFGRAVSPVTSYLAAEPGVRPSPIGLLRGGAGGLGAGYGGLGTRGFGSGGGGRRAPNLRALVDEDAQLCIARHAPRAPWSVRLDVETTRDEVVDVQRTTASTGTDALVDCLIEAVWVVRLDGSFSDERMRYPLEWHR